MASKGIAAAAKAATPSFLNWGQDRTEAAASRTNPPAGGGEQPTSG
jgi:hypothetical protein